MPSNPATMEGLLLVDKPTGPTSHDIVASIRNLLNVDKAGHAGTLDPLASGLLIILVGRATKLAPFVPGDPKVYEGSMLLGLSTDSMDIQGTIIHEGLYSGGPDVVREALFSMRGKMEQVPPMYSAAKYRGHPLYHYARRGQKVPRKSRTVYVYQIEMTDFRRNGSKPECDFTITCSPGFYVRDLASRVGEKLGCGATLSRLRRVSSGPFQVEEALSMEELSRRHMAESLKLLPLKKALNGLKAVVVKEEAVRAIVNGAEIDEGMIDNMDDGIEEGDIVAVVDYQQDVLGLHSVTSKGPYNSRPRRII